MPPILISSLPDERRAAQPQSFTATLGTFARWRWTLGSEDGRAASLKAFAIEA